MTKATLVRGTHAIVGGVEAGGGHGPRQSPHLMFVELSFSFTAAQTLPELLLTTPFELAVHLVKSLPHAQRQAFEPRTTQVLVMASECGRRAAPEPGAAAR